MEMFWKIIRRCLFSFDAEKVHIFVTALLKGLHRFGFKFLIRILAQTPKKRKTHFIKRLNQDFLSPIGVAAGFDKNGTFFHVLPELGFGFVEIGTVTPLAQVGNPKPRLFRLPDQKALLNRMGFNNDGAVIIAERIRAQRKLIPQGFRIGLNIGKNKDTPLIHAWKDYVAAVIPFENIVDFIVINVSSPNTLGLRDLQEEETLKVIFEKVSVQTASWRVSVPIFLKLAPEVQGESLKQLVEAGNKWKVGGWVLSNTLKTSSGGLSGKPLAGLSLEALKIARQITDRPIISAGGIFSSEDVAIRMKNGSDLCEVYSGWIYKGPRFARNLEKGLLLG